MRLVEVSRQRQRQRQTDRQTGRQAKKEKKEKEGGGQRTIKNSLRVLKKNKEY